jgi:CubicO group peptidase (beta-lactamase class C family)
VGTWLPALAGSDKATITVRQLLCHQSGFPAHRLFYMTLKTLLPLKRNAAVLDLLKRTPWLYRREKRPLYSDLGFMLLCRLVEAVAGCRMNEFLKAEIYGPLGLNDLFFVDLTRDHPPSRLLPLPNSARCATGCWSAKCTMTMPGLPEASTDTPACSARPRLFFSSFGS